jgi:CRISPR-associated protein Cpf1
MVAYFFPMKKTKDGMEFIKSRDEENEDFYDDLHFYFDDNLVVEYFNLFRNFVSKKPYSIEKVNVNFETSTLLT